MEKQKSQRHCWFSKRQCVFILSILLVVIANGQPPVEYVINGSFENIPDCDPPYTQYKLKGWSSVDSGKFAAFYYNIKCNTAPNTQVGYQVPKSGDGFCRMTLYCLECGPTNNRSNLRNRLKRALRNGKSYCATVYVNTQNDCPKAIDGFGVYFGGTEIDTVKSNANSPLTFFTPQVQNAPGNIINDTLNWVSVSGEFKSLGTEKYLVFSNFKSDVATFTANTGFSSGWSYSEYFVDDVSCLEIDAYAFSTRDTSIMSGDSIYLGRKPEPGVPVRFKWFALPSPNVIDTSAGFWSKPSGPVTYVVEQQTCGFTTRDTVRLGFDAVGLPNIQSYISPMIYPNPVNDLLSIDLPKSPSSFTIKIFDEMGRLLKNGEGVEVSTQIPVEDLSDGIYFIEIKSNKVPTRIEKLIISR